MTAPLASRRGFITGLISLVAAPAIVRAGSLMPVRTMIQPGIRYRAISVEEMIDQMMGAPAISAALMDLGVFGSAVVSIGQHGIRHIPLQEFHP
jgi:hypothetical protein